MVELNKLNQTPIVYDVETYPNCFLVCTWNGFERRTFIKGLGYDDIEELLATLANRVLVGYNNHNYDDVILECLYKNPYMSNSNIFSLNEEIIQGRRYKSNLGTIDLFEIMRKGRNYQRLKFTGIITRQPNIQDLPIKPGTYIKANQLNDLIEYCHNDVHLTNVILQKLKTEIEMRFDLGEEFDLNLMVSDSQLGKKLFEKFFKERSIKGLGGVWDFNKEIKTIPIKDVVIPIIKFQTKHLQDWFEEFKNKTALINDKREFDRKSIKSKLELTQADGSKLILLIGLGGIHSKDEPTLEKSTEDRKVLDIDVESQYPNLVLNWGIHPSHLDGEVFLGTMRYVKDKRVHHKARRHESKRDETLQKGLKNCINSVVGQFNYPTFWLYDPMAYLKVTINNQLLVLMLIEDLIINNFFIISANTDGITLYEHKSQKNLRKKITNSWEKLTNFDLEENIYEVYARDNVNNYLAVLSNGKVKTKGLFLEPEDITKGYKAPIIPKCLKYYYLGGDVPIEDYIRTFKNIHDFIIGAKIGKNRVCQEADVILKTRIYKVDGKSLLKDSKTEMSVKSLKVIQNTIRYIIVNPDLQKFEEGVGYTTTGKTLLSAGDNGTTSLEAGYHTKLYNKIESVDVPENINYDYYIKKINVIISKIGML